MMTARGEAAAFAGALGFLTRLPLPSVAVPGGMARALRYVPAAGAVVGAIGAAVLLAAAAVLPMGPAVLLATAATALVTGALHEDGLADSFDAAGAPTRERALEIMRDSRIGTYGALALGLVVALKVSALAALAPGAAAAALVAGHAASRFSAVAVIATSRYARLAGTAGFTADGLGHGGLVVAAVTALLALLPVAATAGDAAVFAGAAGLGLGHLAARALFERRLGGYTGDSLGATQQIGEAAFYLGVAAWA